MLTPGEVTGQALVRECRAAVRRARLAAVIAFPVGFGLGVLIVWAAVCLAA